MVNLINNSEEDAMMLTEEDGSVILKDICVDQVSDAVSAICNLVESVVEVTGEDPKLTVLMWTADPFSEYKLFTSLKLTGIRGQEVIVDLRDWKGCAT